MNTSQRENPLFSLAFNVVIPSLILLKLSDDDSSRCVCMRF